MKKLILTLLIMAFAAPLLKAQGEDTLWTIKLLSGALAIKFSPDEKIFYVVTSTGVEKHDSETGDSISSFKGKSLGDWFARFSADGSKVLCAANFSISVWDVEKEELMWSKSVYDMDTTYGIIDISWWSGGTINLSYDGKYAYFPIFNKADSNNFMVYNVSEQKIEKMLNHKYYLGEIAASPDGKYLITESTHSEKFNYFYSATLWDAEKMLPIKEIERNQYPPRFFKFSYDSKKIAYSDKDSNKIYDIETGKSKYYGGINNNAPYTLWDYCFSKDNNYLVMCDKINYQYRLGIWSVQDKELKKEYPGIYSHCYEMTKDNKKLLVGGYDQNDPGKICMFRPNLAGNTVKDFPTPSPFKFLTSSSKLDIIPDGSCQITGIDIANSAGKIVMSQSMEGNWLSIDISALASGAYYCRIKCGEKVYTEAFAVTR